MTLLRGTGNSWSPWSSCLTPLSFWVWDLQPLTVLFLSTFSQEQSDHGFSGTKNREG